MSRPPVRREGDAVPLTRASGVRRYGEAVLIAAITTGVNGALYGRLTLANLAMINLLGVLAASYRLGFGPAILTTVLGVLAFDFFFTEPRFSLSMNNVQDIFLLLVMLVVALAISRLTGTARTQAHLAIERERRSASLYALSRELAVNRGAENLLGIVLGHVATVMTCSAVALTPDEFGLLHPARAAGPDARLPASETTSASLAFRSGQILDADERDPLHPRALYVPLIASGESVGALRVERAATAPAFSSEEIRQLEAFAQLAAMSISTERLAGR